MLTGIPFVDAHGALRAGQLVEVCGVGGSGKTEILMQAAVNCALPRERRGVRFGGCESSVLLLDLDGKFDTLRLLKILTARIEDAIARFIGTETAPDLRDPEFATLSDETYRESVGRFQMVRCHNSLDFLKALSVVDVIFKRREFLESTKMPRSASSLPRRLLLVDNVAAFYWLDRASRREHGAPLSLHAVHHCAARKLLDISRRCRAPIIATKALVKSEFRIDDRSERVSDRVPVDAPHAEFLPPGWTSAVTQRLVLDVERGVLPNAKRFAGRGGAGNVFVARWELPKGRPDAKYRVDGEAGITRSS